MIEGQNFSVPAGDAASFNIVLDEPFPSGFPSGWQVEWQAFDQTYGNPTVPPIIVKGLSGGIDFLESPPTLTILLDGADTVALLGNYFHVATFVDPSGARTTSASGIMTVTLTGDAIS